MVYVIVAVVLFFLLSTITIYNSLIRRKNDVENAFASIDIMLRKRYDLIPEIVEAVKAYVTYERELLTEITALRVRAISQDLSNEERVIVENKIDQQHRGLSVKYYGLSDEIRTKNTIRNTPGKKGGD